SPSTRQPYRIPRIFLDCPPFHDGHSHRTLGSHDAYPVNSRHPPDHIASACKPALTAAMCLLGWESPTLVAGYFLKGLQKGNVIILANVIADRHSVPCVCHFNLAP